MQGWASYFAKQELADHAKDEVGPEYVQAQQHQQHHIEEVVPKESRVMKDGVDPCAVNQPEYSRTESSLHSAQH